MDLFAMFLMSNEFWHGFLVGAGIVLGIALFTILAMKARSTASH
jgi:threonine/homoserine/homoserine lactone efflux protein